MRLDAYYYGFEPTGVEAIDRILSAVACAGKAYHLTEDWQEEVAPYEPFLRGSTPVEWIQNAAADAAAELGSGRTLADANQNPTDLSSLRKGAEVAVADAARDLLFHLELYDFSERDPSGELNEKMADLKAALVSGSREDGADGSR